MLVSLMVPDRPPSVTSPFIISLQMLDTVTAELSVDEEIKFFFFFLGVCGC